MYIKMCCKLCHLIRGIRRLFHKSKDFEIMKAGRLAIWPKLSCQYSENTLMDLLSSFKGDHKYHVLWKSYFRLRNLCAYNFFIIPNTDAVGTFSGP